MSKHLNIKNWKLKIGLLGMFVILGAFGVAFSRAGAQFELPTADTSGVILLTAKSACLQTKLITKLDWTDSSSALISHYTVYRRSGSDNVTLLAGDKGASTYNDDTNLVSATTYVYRIMAQRTDGASDWSNPVTLTAKECGTHDFTLSNGGDLLVESGGVRTQTVNANLAETDANLVAADRPLVALSLISALPTGISASWSNGAACRANCSRDLQIHASAQPPQGVYRVKIQGVSGKNTHTTEFNLTLIQVIPPPGAFTLTVTPDCKESASVNKLSWTLSPRAVAYAIYRNGVPYASAGKATTYDDIRAEAGKDYKYQVVAINYFGVRSNSADGKTKNCSTQ